MILKINGGKDDEAQNKPNDSIQKNGKAGIENT